MNEKQMRTYDVIAWFISHAATDTELAAILRPDKNKQQLSTYA